MSLNSSNMPEEDLKDDATSTSNQQQSQTLNNDSKEPPAEKDGLQKEYDEDKQLTRHLDVTPNASRDDNKKADDEEDGGKPIDYEKNIEDDVKPIDISPKEAVFSGVKWYLDLAWLAAFILVLYAVLAGLAYGMYICYSRSSNVFEAMVLAIFGLFFVVFVFFVIYESRRRRKIKAAGENSGRAEGVELTVADIVEKSRIML